MIKPIQDMTTAEVDEAVLRVIRQGVTSTFSYICLAVGIDPATREMRAVDRSLQRLRKQGRVQYRDRRWCIL